LRFLEQTPWRTIPENDPDPGLQFSFAIWEKNKLLCLFLTYGTGRWTQEVLRITEQRHEYGVHVILLMAVEHGVSGVVGNQVGPQPSIRLPRDNIF